eukprot:TRINITY_DN14301_c0_g1_i5.p1 TRINITY_DN14301_c0_g1~~TRINITY_DN14301_c0_g1_i5.p1  ORF type:complete len:152 (-),score=19.17 TRINITY_DN14301_c0_g1_i5:42-497(-)
MRTSVHSHIRKMEGDSYSKTWIQRWFHSNKPNKIIRSKKQPSGCIPFVAQVPRDWIITTGDFSGPNCQLDDKTTYHLQSLGYLTYSYPSTVQCSALPEADISHMSLTRHWSQSVPPYSALILSLIHISEPTRLLSISYAVFCLKKKKNNLN